MSQAIADEPDRVWSLTGRSNAVAVLSNGTAVLGLGDIGPEAAMPVMEGKAVLFKQFGGVDAYPVCVDARTVDEMVAIGKAIAPTFGGINLEDIKAPECFEIERRLQDELDIPVFHDDQHGTAIVALAALINAATVVGKRVEELRVVIVGTGAAGVAVAELLHDARVGQDGTGDIIGVDSTGILHRERENLTPTKQWFVENGNCDDRRGGVREALQGADVLLGLSGPGIIQPEWLAEMADDSDRVRDGEPDARSHARTDAVERVGHRHGPQRLPEPDQQRARLPRRVPRHARRAGHPLHHRDEASGGRCTRWSRRPTDCGPHHSRRFRTGCRGRDRRVGEAAGRRPGARALLKRHGPARRATAPSVNSAAAWGKVV